MQDGHCCKASFMQDGLSHWLFPHVPLHFHVQVFGSLYSLVSPTPAAGEPKLVAYSKEVRWETV